MRGPLIGRQESVASIRALLDAAAGGSGGALMLRGPAGIGRTELLRQAVSQAGRAGYQVVGSATADDGAGSPYQVVDHLLRPLAAASGRDGMLPADDHGAQPFAVAQTVLHLVTFLAGRGPVLVIADDLHTAGAADATVLSFLGRRLRADRVALLGSYRDDEATQPDLVGLPELPVEPLTPADAELIIRRHAPELHRSARVGLLTKAQGNPLALVELAENARSDQKARLGVRSERSFARRTATLPEPVRVALLVAALGDGGLDEVVAAAGIVLGGPFTADGLEPAVAARQIDPPGLTGTVRFRHPLVRLALRQNAAADLRRACHRALAQVIREPSDRRAWHRAAAAEVPDEAIAAELEEAGTVLLRRGSAGAANRLLTRSAELTAGAEARQRRLTGALLAAYDMGDLHEVRRLSSVIDVRLLDLPARLATALARETRPWFRSPPPLGGTARPPARSHPGQVAVALRAVALRMHWCAGEDDPLRTALLTVLDDLPLPPDAPGRLINEALLAPTERGAELLRHVRDVHATAALLPVEIADLGRVAQITGDLALSARLIDRAVAALEAESSLGNLVEALITQALTAVLLGHIDQAERHVAEILRLAAETGQPHFLVVGKALGAAAAGLRGHTGEALAVPDEGLPALALARMGRGLGALSGDDPATAYDELVAIFTPAAPGHHLVLGTLLVQPLAEAAVRAERRDELAVLVALLEQVAIRTASPHLNNGLRYARAVLAGDDEADRSFQDALAAPDLTVLGRAHLELAYGQSLRRRRRDPESRPYLRSAHRAYEALGMTPWSGAARAHLRAAGERVEAPRPDARDVLNAQELNVAVLAAQGLSNREIAQRLHLSPRTIGSYLYKIFPKLGITSRNELAGALGSSRHARFAGNA